MLTKQQRTNAYDLIENMVKQRKKRNEIIAEVERQIKVTRRSAINLVSHSNMVANNIDVVKQNNRVKLENDRTESALKSVSINLDTKHPHIEVARIIDSKPGMTGEFRAGVIIVNGREYPTPNAYKLAGKQWPPVW